MSKKIDVSKIAHQVGTLYPPPFHTPCLARSKQALGDEAGLTQFGVNLLRLASGSQSSQRHWHTHEDEFIYLLSGEVICVSDDGEETLKAGDAAGFKGGDENGHCLRNDSETEAVILEIGSRIKEDGAFYPDIDLCVEPIPDGEVFGYKHRDGTPYPPVKRRGPGDE